MKINFNDSDYDNISSIIKFLESTLYDKIKQKNEIISKLLEENKLLRDQIDKKNNRKNNKKNNKVNTKVLSELYNDNKETVININSKPAKPAQVKEAKDFFEKEYINYLNKSNNNKI